MPNTLPPNLLKAYLETDYVIFSPPLKIVIDQEHNKALDELLIEHHAHYWAFITAWNPRSEPLAYAENEQRMRELLAKTTEYPQFLGEGRSRTGDWEAEASVLLLGITEKKALEIAAYFEQNAIVYGYLHEKATLKIP